MTHAEACTEIDFMALCTASLCSGSNGKAYEREASVQYEPVLQHTLKY